ncbi:MAG: GatB/YqeY domain-containing protein [Candidatus Marinimicrobia bacterium]|jgi:hypothetical protein|nr:GatB/YqeY domain-containing protein [Candidatus Neomarinimicrobiota bacterium]MBT3634609.1 GatB/YqeY domain-containing protein [Candidatus Neomarinimicrobiota bacterium]MBT3683310.1 GatB/YqeY domain-containing protein [Candidatus Neomarinimicrobiota bacterium]MBT3760263.1 GatB/YqeY domain-containing protein [Candidatus Neomarinimicrobiota bacterium]MBT3896358.1 GatB/YqeY domain-containing protein [Candidatus Neomarinimicrobiota bacterium]
MLNSLQTKMKDAMKSRNKAAVTAYRNIIAKIKAAQIDSGKTLNDEECLKILMGYVKQLKDSIDQFNKADRADLAEVESYELSLMDEYLPEQLSEDEIRNLVKDVIKDTGAESMKDMGRVMSVVMKAIAGKGDGKLAQQIVRELL